jgi:hypothetical protein
MVLLGEKMPQRKRDLLLVPKQYVWSYGKAIREKKLFESLGPYFMFIGYPRSGHS